MITNLVPEQMAKLIINENPSQPIYIALGTSTVESTRGDTVMVGEEIRFLKTDSGAISGVTWIQGEMDSITGTGKTYSEFGTFDDPTAGNLYDREAIPGVPHHSTSNTRVTRFMSVSPENSSKNIITNVGINSLGNWMAGTTFTEPNYIAWGTELILDECGTLGTNPNHWSQSTDAGTAQLNISEYQEGTASIKMGKEGVSGTTFYYERTLASAIDASNATNFRIWINPKDPTDYAKLTASTAMTLRIGNDSSNYKEIGFDRGDLFIGWQRLDTPITSMVNTGSPDLSTTDYMRITWNTTNSTATITKGNLLMDYWSFYWLMDETDTALHDEKARKTVDTVQRVGNVARFKEDLEKTEGNTYDYVQTGLFNAVSGGDLFYENDHGRIRKDSYSKLIQEVSLTFKID